LGYGDPILDPGIILKCQLCACESETVEVLDLALAFSVPGLSEKFVG
jgi:hypothetical protein